MPQVRRAESILGIVARDSEEERESEAKREVQSMISYCSIASRTLNKPRLRHNMLHSKSH